MKSLHIITPVKDSIDLTLETAKAILESEITVPYTYTIYNDFSTDENTARLEKAAVEMGFELINLIISIMIYLYQSFSVAVLVLET